MKIFRMRWNKSGQVRDVCHRDIVGAEFRPENGSSVAVFKILLKGGRQYIVTSSEAKYFWDQYSIWISRKVPKGVYVATWLAPGES